MTDHPWRPKSDYPAWILPFLVGFSVGGFVGYFLLR